MAVVLTLIGVVVFIGVIALATSIRVLREYERGVIFRLGRLIGQKGPGLIFLIPIIDKIVQVENYLVATSQIAQTTLRAVLGRAELDTLLSERERLNEELQKIIDEQTEPWGIKVSTVEIKDVEIPQTMQRAMARQAEAERERRAKIIAAEGEFQASDKLAQAAATIGREPVAIQLRFLQTLVEVASGQNSTTIFPLPIDLFRPFLQRTGASGGSQPAGESLPPPD